MTEIQDTITSLSSLTERLQTWNKIIKEIDAQERDFLYSCLNCDTNNLELLKSNKENIEQILELRKIQFSALTQRLSIPIKFYSEIIENIELSDFIIRAKELRKKADTDCILKAENLAEKYLAEYPEKSRLNHILTPNSYVKTG